MFHVEHFLRGCDAAALLATSAAALFLAPSTIAIAAAV
jgi:hypothetical protein